MNWPGGVGQIILDEVDSTNAEAARAFALGTPAPFWMFAHRQSAGRGRRGRPWRAGPGNFTATYMVAVPQGPEVASQRSFVAAIALQDALAELGGEALSLKWPNDVLLRGRKLAGILLESEMVRGVLMLRIGIGVNLANTPPMEALEEGALPAIHLEGRIAPLDFLTRMAQAYAKAEAVHLAQGFEPIRLRWLAGAARLGEVIRARLPNEEITGTFETVDARGALVMTTARGQVVLPAADVFF